MKIFSVLFEVFVLDPGFYLILALFHIIVEGKHLKIYWNKISIYEEVIRSSLNSWSQDALFFLNEINFVSSLNFWRYIGNILCEKAVFPQECSWLQALQGPHYISSSRDGKTQDSRRDQIILIGGHWGDWGADWGLPDSLRDPAVECVVKAECYQNDSLLCFCFF